MTIDVSNCSKSVVLAQFIMKNMIRRIISIMVMILIIAFVNVARRMA